jgi:DNA-binding NarL/FixJ family response regulator
MFDHSPVAVKASRVFVIDSSVFVRESIKRLLDDEEEFMICGEAENVQTGIEKILETKPDIIIMDLLVNDKETNGLDLIKAIKLADINLPILVLSSYDESIHAQDVLCAGAQGYLMKQDARKNLVHAIQQVLAGETYVSVWIKSKATHYHGTLRHAV